MEARFAVYFDADPEFLQQLTRKSPFRCLARFDVAAWETPKIRSVKEIWAAMNHQDALGTNERANRNTVGHDLSQAHQQPERSSSTASRPHRSSRGTISDETCGTSNGTTSLAISVRDRYQ